ncbi:tyrosine-protein phosphatase non-receptor type 20 isoform 2-T10 [Thomomys bottae]
MSSPRKVKGKSGKDNESDQSKLEDLNFPKSVTSSSKKKTSLKKVFEKKVNSEKARSSLQNFPRKDYKYLLQEASGSDSDDNVWHDEFFEIKRDSTEATEPAGPSKIPSPVLLGEEKIVSEGELTQLSQIRPLEFDFNEQTYISDCLKMLKKKVADFDFIQEFKDLEHIHLPDEFTTGIEPHNREKNRYRDILPYDSTRVPLGKSNDYINASYIRIVNFEEEYFYIATQGPLSSTTDDFWQMVLENNCNVIAMITREIEGGNVKCHHYWPYSLKEPLELKHVRIFLENHQILRYFIIRMLQVVKKSTGASHLVKHLQFTSWPDHGTPASADYFIKFVRYVRKSHVTGPIVVHCSAGVGRTGVFICADVVFCAIEKNYSFNILNIVTQMREQRPGMIQTKIIQIHVNDLCPHMSNDSEW